MNTPATEVKTAVTSEVEQLRQDVDAAWKMHKWFFIGGLVIGIVLGAFLAHTL